LHDTYFDVSIRLQSLLFYIPKFLDPTVSFFFLYYEFQWSNLSTMHCAIKKYGAPGALSFPSWNRVVTASTSIIGACKMCTPATALSRHRLHCTFAFAAVPKPRVSASAVDWRSLLCTAPAPLLIHLRYHAAYTMHLRKPRSQELAIGRMRTVTKEYRYINLVIIRKWSTDDDLIMWNESNSVCDRFNTW